jgi:multicomponent Na+:H+ antiporter subunit B
MKTIILKTASNYLLPLLLLFSVFILLRGHYLPGGGFVGGLVAAIAFVLHAFANGLSNTRLLLKYQPRILIPFGLGLSLVSGFVPMLFGEPFMKGLWFPEPLPVIGMIGSALFFDIGVYFVVIGVTLTILFTISETTQLEEEPEE